MLQIMFFVFFVLFFVYDYVGILTHRT